jgi:hypothetical protein
MCNPLNGWDTAHWECLTYCESPPNCAPWTEQVSHADWMGPTCFCPDGVSNRSVGRLAQTAHKAPKSNHSSTWPPQCKKFYEINKFDKCLNGSVLKHITGPNVTAADW